MSYKWLWLDYIRENKFTISDQQIIPEIISFPLWCDELNVWYLTHHIAINYKLQIQKFCVYFYVYRAMRYSPGKNIAEIARNNIFHHTTVTQVTSLYTAGAIFQSGQKYIRTITT